MGQGGMAIASPQRAQPSFGSLRFQPVFVGSWSVRARGLVTGFAPSLFRLPSALAAPARWGPGSIGGLCGQDFLRTRPVSGGVLPFSWKRQRLYLHAGTAFKGLPDLPGRPLSFLVGFASMSNPTGINGGGKLRQRQLGLTDEELARRIAKMKAKDLVNPVVKPPSKKVKHSVPLAEQMKNWTSPTKRWLPLIETKKSRLKWMKKYEQYRPTDWWAPRGKRHK